MPIACPSCGHAFELQPSGVEVKATAPCPACGRVVVVRDATQVRPDSVHGTVPYDPATAAALEPLEGDATAIRGRSTVGLPPGKRVSLAVLSGPRSGEIIPVSKPRVTLGRAGGGADLEFDDPEMSRSHAALEWAGGGASLVDLSSTNGSYVAEQKITTQGLEDKSEFRLGHTRLLLVITDRE